MRIAHIVFGQYVPDAASGVSKAVYHLAVHQARMGVEVGIFSFSKEVPQMIPGVQVYHLHPPRQGTFYRILPWTYFANLKTLLRWGPDIVHFHSVHIGPFLALGRALRHAGIPYVVTPHGALAPGRLKSVHPLVRVYMRLLEVPFWDGAAFVHAVSRNDALGAGVLGVRAPVVVVPNGLDPSEVPQHPDKEALFRFLPQLKGRRVFLFLGRLDPQHKGLDMLLEAWARSRPKNGVLLFLGPDWKGGETRLRQRIRELALEEEVFLGGAVFGEIKWAYLTAADVFVHPSRWEAGIPLSVLEAMAVGKPLLVTSPADPEGWVVAAGAGVVAEPRPEAIACGLDHLGSLSEEELAQMGEQGRKLLLERFSWEKIANEMLSAYGRVLHSLGSGG